MQSKTAQRKRRAHKARGAIRNQSRPRLSVHRTPRHMYAQVVQPDGSRTLASASTLQADVREQCDQTGNRGAAAVVGRVVAERAKAEGISEVAFDRAGFAYHGRVEALADAAREHGLSF